MNSRKKNIWIFHHYATPPTMSGLTRPYDFGVELIEHGYDTTVFSSSYLHFSDENLINGKDDYIINNDTEIPFVFINTPSYINSGVKRVLNMISFYKKLFKVSKSYIKDNSKPDIIIASSPHPLTMIAGIKIAKRYKIPCICEVRDFWPEVFFTGGVLKEDSIIGKILKRGERWIYEKSNSIIFLKEGDKHYIIDNKWDIKNGGKIELEKCHYINNGINVEKFNKQIKSNALNDEDLNSSKFTVVYAGSIRPVNNVGNIIDAAVKLKEYNNIQFLIYGQGNQVEELKKRIRDEGLKNVKMKGYVSKDYIPYILSKSSVNILNYSQEKYNWSRGNSSNKLFEYMASGKPIISTVKMGYCPLQKYSCGLSIDGDSRKELSETILEIYNMENKEYQCMCKNALKAANDFDYTELTNKLILVMERLI